jgi:hypothetical protein
MRKLFLYCLFVACIMGLLIAFVVQEDPTTPAVGVRGVQGEEQKEPLVENTQRTSRPFWVQTPPEQPEQATVDSNPPLTPPDPNELGKPFHDKWYADRSLLGPAQHKNMEKLWLEGRRPRGDPNSISRLEQLINAYPNTNRAGCAAFELGHHYLKNKSLDPGTRRQKARTYWHMVDERYRDSVCEYNAPAAGLSKLALANWIYRHTDPGMARRLLEELIRDHQGETDHLGKPLAQSAQKILELIDRQR